MALSSAPPRFESRASHHVRCFLQGVGQFVYPFSTLARLLELYTQDLDRCLPLKRVFIDFQFEQFRYDVSVFLRSSHDQVLRRFGRGCHATFGQIFGDYIETSLHVLFLLTGRSFSCPNNHFVGVDGKT